ncbi:uncharacterized protein ZBT109_0157 [Zymobacter palmae]|uniref:Uncharacterized protein n=1 Tax=Zymobacter palmae TaxID=33074 RepID=A0A348HBF3_9GAMM|nr:uncharacterized protein ZBT109_0157 [Zymobacter palmae]
MGYASHALDYDDFHAYLRCSQLRERIAIYGQALRT